MASATEIWNYRSLTANLARREMRAQYKKSILGSLWSLINPLSVLPIGPLRNLMLAGCGSTSGDVNPASDLSDRNDQQRSTSQ